MQYITSRSLVPCFLCAFFYCTVVSCETIQQSSKYQFTEGYYSSRLFPKPRRKAYIVPSDDSIKVYTAKSLQRKAVDTSTSLSLAFPSNSRPLNFTNYSFRAKTLDLDVLTVLFKYRPAVKNFPPQLNATFNGAVYFGYRTDVYQLTYRKTPLQVYKRSITHYGFSAGVFSGFGTARIDEFVTNGALNTEYDGVVNLSGIAAIIAVNKLSFGLTGGVDHLLDHNKKYWVNNTKPWLGLSVGLNIN